MKKCKRKLIFFLSVMFFAFICGQGIKADEITNIAASITNETEERGTNADGAVLAYLNDELNVEFAFDISSYKANTNINGEISTFFLAIPYGLEYAENSLTCEAISGGNTVVLDKDTDYEIRNFQQMKLFVNADGKLLFFADLHSNNAETESATTESADTDTTATETTQTNSEQTDSVAEETSNDSTTEEVIQTDSMPEETSGTDSIMEEAMQTDDMPEETSKDSTTEETMQTDSTPEDTSEEDSTAEENMQTESVAEETSQTDNSTQEETTVNDDVTSEETTETVEGQFYLLDGSQMLNGTLENAVAKYNEKNATTYTTDEIIEAAAADIMILNFKNSDYSKADISYKAVKNQASNSTGIMECFGGFVYSNQTENTETMVSIEESVSVYSYGLRLTLCDGENIDDIDNPEAVLLNAKRLSEAVFSIYSYVSTYAVEDTEGLKSAIDGLGGNEYYTIPTEDASAYKLYQHVADCITDTDGEALMGGLQPLEYLVIESGYPVGYEVFCAFLCIEENDWTDDTYMEGRYVFHAIWLNFPGLYLPNTGNSGIYILQWVGILIILSALGLIAYLYKKYYIKR